jgi:hypothetical protein
LSIRIFSKTAKVQILTKKAAQPPLAGEARRFILRRFGLCVLGLYLLFFYFSFFIGDNNRIAAVPTFRRHCR